MTAGAISRAIVLIGVVAICAGIFASLTLAPPAAGLEGRALASVGETGAANPVTAVLLDYRGYDTFLELAVVLLALLGSGMLAAPQRPLPPLSGPVAGLAGATLAPAIAIFGGYLLWTGADAPGGAFQSGALLAGGLILLDALGLPLLPQIRQARWLWGAVGVAAFLLVGLGVMVPGAAFLDYPAPLAKPLVLAIEAAAAIGVAVSLAALFAAGTERRR